MVNKGLEALGNLVHCKSITKCNECKHKNRCTMEKDYDLIKQDLEHLEQLEKENQELKGKLEISQKANKELSFTANAYAKAQKPYIEKIQKLEETIDNLKKYIEFIFDDENQEINLFWVNEDATDLGTIEVEDKEEYNSFKEVLE